MPIAEVVKAVGLRGEVKLYPLLDFYEPLLDSGFLVWESGGAVPVERFRPAGQCVAVKMSGTADRTGAEALVGRTLGFRREDYLDATFPRPVRGLPFRYLGRPVRTQDGLEVGVVDEVRLAGGNFLLVIPDGTREILIPAVEPILRADDGLDGPLEIDPPEGLLDVQSG